LNTTNRNACSIYQADAAVIVGIGDLYHGLQFIAWRPFS